MPTPIETRLTGNLTGVTNDGPLTPVPLGFTLIGQAAHSQFTVNVASTDVLKSVSLPTSPGGAGTAQTLLMIRSDQNTQVRLNGVPALHFSISQDGPLILPGLPEITQLEFTGIGTTAKVFITKIVGTQTLPVPSGGGAGVPVGGLRLENLGPATLGQTAFTLAATPTNPTAAVLFIDGVQTSSPTFFTLSGTALTWLDAAPFGAFAGGERVEILYQ